MYKVMTLGVQACSATSGSGKHQSYQETQVGWVVVHDFNPSTQKARQVDLCESETSLVYRGNSKIAKATQRNPCPEKQINRIKNNKRL